MSDESSYEYPYEEESDSRTDTPERPGTQMPQLRHIPIWTRPQAPTPSPLGGKNPVERFIVCYLQTMFRASQLPSTVSSDADLDDEKTQKTSSSSSSEQKNIVFPRDLVQLIRAYFWSFYFHESTIFKRDDDALMWDLWKKITDKMQIISIEMIYSGERDGFRLHDFHFNCTGKGTTVVVIESEFGHVFGGFTKAPWGSGYGYATDEDAFLFLFKADPVIIEKYDLVLPLYLPRHSSKLATRVSRNIEFGAHFDEDIRLVEACNLNAGNHSHFPHSFSNESGDWGAERRDKTDLLAGREHFEVRAIEVYLVHDPARQRKPKPPGEPYVPPEDRDDGHDHKKSLANWFRKKFK